MINVFKIRKWGALLVPGFLSVILFVVGNLYYSLMGGVGFFLVGLLLGVLVSNMLLKNPFSDMLEGKGILALDVNSTGVIRPFIVGVQSPYIRGKLGNEAVNDTFDRDSIFNFATPQKAGTAVPQQDGGLNITLTEEEYHRGRMALMHYPVLIWNQQIKSMVTKEWLSGKEKDAFAEHGILYLNRKMEELTSVVRDFGRYVVELTKPKDGFLKGKWWVWVLIVGFIVILAVMFGPAIIQTFQGAAQTVGSVAGTATVPPPAT